MPQTVMGLTVRGNRCTTPDDLGTPQDQQLAAHLVADLGYFLWHITGVTYEAGPCCAVEVAVLIIVLRRRED